MKERPLLIAVIGYIIGILWGLYFEFSIVLCYILIFAIYYILKQFLKSNQKHKFRLLSLNRYFRYLKLIISKKVIFIFIIISSISNLIVSYKNNQYENTFLNGENIQIEAIVVSKKIEKQYYDLYKVKLLDSRNLNLYIQVNKKNEKLEYGDRVKLEGQFKKPSEQRNYGGYDDSKYLKTLKVVGRVKVNKIDIVKKKQMNYILQLANEIKEKIQEKIESNFNKEHSAILKGLLLGDTSNIQEETKEQFQTANISHVLAISGMHINYIVIGIITVFKKIIGKRKSKIMTILILIFYTFITGFSPSIARAVIMAIIIIGGEIIYRKSDTANSIAISLLIILLYNPFLILNIGLQLSYIATIGIILFHKSFFKIDNGNQVKNKKFNKIKEIVTISLSVQIAILPISLHYFNYISIYFILTNLLVSIIIGPLIILGFLSIISNLFVIPVNIGLEALNFVTKFSKLPFSKIYFPTPNIIVIILYWISILITKQIYLIYHKNHLTATDKRVKNLIALFRYRFHLKKKRNIIAICIIFIIALIISIQPKDLKIHFVDVGQGDCTFILTPKNKSILVDGGGSLSEENDVGEKILVPYLLDRGYTSIDYLVVSHADQDHIRTDYLQ